MTFGIKTTKEHFSQGLGRIISNRDDEIRAIREIEEKTNGAVSLREAEKGERPGNHQEKRMNEFKEQARAEAAKLIREGKSLLNQKIKEAIARGDAKGGRFEDDDD